MLSHISGFRTWSSNRSGFALIGVVVAMVAILTLSMVMYRYSVTQRATMDAQQRLAASDFTAEGLARVMVDRLVAKAEDRLGMLTEEDIAELNAELPSLPLPANVELDVAASGYTLVAVEHGNSIPHDAEPLRVISDHPRSESGLSPNVGGAQAMRTVEVVILASIVGHPAVYRSAIARLGVSKVLPYQRVLHSAGDLEFCVSPGSQVVVSGRIRAEGRIESICEGSRVISGEIYAAQELVVEDDDGTNHVLRTSSQDAGLVSISGAEQMAGNASLLAAWGGRVRVGEGIGSRVPPSDFQSDEIAGSGECQDFDGACGGRGVYNPSITIHKTTDASSTAFNVQCGVAYQRVGAPAVCVDQANGAVRYEAYPFSGITPDGSARISPLTGEYWQGLFPDARRQNRCAVEVDGVIIQSYRCDTAPYGYVIDLGLLGKVEGGLLSIRRTQNGMATHNPSRNQEVVLIRNAEVLWGPLTIHSELPVYIAGDFNRHQPRPAMIDAPMITLIPADYAVQARKRSLWDDDASVTPEPFVSAGRTEIHGVLRTRYSPRSGEAYYGGSVESAPHVLGNYSRADLLIQGAAESRAWDVDEVGAFASHHHSYTDIPASVAPRQPAFRVLRYEPNLRGFEFQIPGSWSPENQPLDGEGPRDASRQNNAAGGLSVIHLVQEPTRIPRDEAIGIALPPASAACDDCVMPDPGPPLAMTSLVCDPATQVAGSPVVCTARAAGGSDPVVEFEFVLEPGVTGRVPAYSGTGAISHVYWVPGTHTVRANALDAAMRRSGSIETQVTILPLPPRINALCITPAGGSPLQLTPNVPEGSGEFLDCTINVIRGSYDVDRHVFNWGDGSSTVQTTAALSRTESHRFAAAGLYTVEMYAVDRGGQETQRQTVTVEARHLPPSLDSFACTPSLVAPGEMVTCEARVSDGSTPDQTFTLDWGDGSPGVNQTVTAGTHTFTHAYHTGSERVEDDRSYTVSASIQDQVGLSDHASDEVTVQTLRPVVSLTCNPTSIYAGAEITCAVSSTTGTFPVTSVRIDFGDGTPQETAGSMSASWAHAFSLPGSYTVRAWARDTRGNDSEPESVLLQITPNLGPANVTVICLPNPVSQGEASACTWSADPGTTPLANWDVEFDGSLLGGAPTQITKTSHVWTFTDARNYTVRIRARDQAGNVSGWAETIVGVNAAVTGAPSMTLVCVPLAITAGNTVTCFAEMGIGTLTGGDLPQNVEWSCDNGQSGVYSGSSYLNCVYPSAGTFYPTARTVSVGGLVSPWAVETVTVSPVSAGATASLSCPASATNAGVLSCSSTITPAPGDTYTGGQVTFNFGGGGATNQTIATPVPSASATGNYVPSQGGMMRTVTATWNSSVGNPSASMQIWHPYQPLVTPSVSCSVAGMAADPAPHSGTVTWAGQAVDQVNWTVRLEGVVQGSGSASVGGAESGSYTMANLPREEAGIYHVEVSAQGSSGTAVSSCSYVVTDANLILAAACDPGPGAVHNGAGGVWSCSGLVENDPLAVVRISATNTHLATGTASPAVCNPASEYAIGSHTCIRAQNTSLLGDWQIEADITASRGSASAALTRTETYTVTPALEYVCEVDGYTGPSVSTFWLTLYDGMIGEYVDLRFEWTVFLTPTVTPSSVHVKLDHSLTWDIPVISPEGSYVTPTLRTLVGGTGTMGTVDPGMMTPMPQFFGVNAMSFPDGTDGWTWLVQASLDLENTQHLYPLYTTSGPVSVRFFCEYR